MNWRIMELDKMVQALQSKSFFASSLESAGDPQYTLVSGGSNDDTVRQVTVTLLLVFRPQKFKCNRNQ